MPDTPAQTFVGPSDDDDDEFIVPDEHLDLDPEVADVEIAAVTNMADLQADPQDEEVR